MGDKGNQIVTRRIEDARRRAEERLVLVERELRSASLDEDVLVQLSIGSSPRCVLGRAAQEAVLEAIRSEGCLGGKEGAARAAAARFVARRLLALQAELYPYAVESPEEASLRALDKARAEGVTA